MIQAGNKQLLEGLKSILPAVIAAARADAPATPAPARGGSRNK